MTFSSERSPSPRCSGDYTDRDAGRRAVGNFRPEYPADDPGWTTPGHRGQFASLPHRGARVGESQIPARAGPAAAVQGNLLRNVLNGLGPIQFDLTLRGVSLQARADSPLFSQARCSEPRSAAAARTAARTPGGVRPRVMKDINQARRALSRLSASALSCSGLHRRFFIPAG